MREIGFEQRRDVLRLQEEFVRAHDIGEARHPPPLDRPREPDPRGRHEAVTTVRRRREESPNVARHVHGKRLKVVEEADEPVRKRDQGSAEPPDELAAELGSLAADQRERLLQRRLIDTEFPEEVGEDEAGVQRVGLVEGIERSRGGDRVGFQR